MGEKHARARRETAQNALASRRTTATESEATTLPTDKAEQELIALRRRYDALAQAAGQVIWKATDDGQMSGDLASWCVFTGQSEAEARGWGWLNAVHPVDRPGMKQAWAEAVERTHQYEHMSRVRRFDGVYCHMLIRGIPVLDARGAIEEWAGFCIDLTDRLGGQYHELAGERAAREAAERTAEEYAALQAVTDTGLIHLELDSLLHALLERIRAVLKTDNAAILLLDSSGEMLTMRAVSGPEEEVAAQVRVPYGRGFAGRIAATRKPLVVQDVREFDVVTTLLKEKLGSIVGVPLLLGERVLGVIHVGTIMPRLFTADDIALLQRAAERVALAVERAMLHETVQAARDEADIHRRELEATFEAIADAVVVYDTRGAIIQANAAARDLMPISVLADFTLQDVAERIALYVPRDENDQLLLQDRLPVSRLLHGELLCGANTVDMTIRLPDGQDMHLNVSGAPVRDEAGRITGAIAVMRDVTARRAQERQVRWQATMLERAHDAIFIWELSQGEIVYWNRGAELLYGFSRAEAIGRISYELLQTTHPDSRDSFEEALARDGEWAGELTHIARDGRVLAILSRHQVLREPDGRRYVLEIGRDITERQILERRTREALDALLEVAAMMVSPALSEGMGEEADEGMGGDGSLDLHVEQAEALRQLTALCCEVLDCARIAIVTVDPETELLRPLTITGASARQERRWRAEVGGLRLTERFGATVTERLRAGEAALVDMAQMRSHDPAQRLSSRRFIIAPMLAEGQLVGYIGANFGDMVDDYSPEQKALTQAVARLVGIVLERWQLQRMRAETQAHALALEETAERMNAFMAIASHELRSPLTSILGGLQISTRRVQKLLVAAEDGMVREGESRDVALQELQELLTRSERQAKRLNRLVGDLIDAVRINAAKFEIVRGPAELTHIVQASVEDQRAAAPARAITVSFPVTGAVPIFADADRISQVVINFLTNAHKYSPEGQPIEVEVRMIGNDQVRVAVRDHGPGLPPEEHARIWQRFHQVEGIEAQNVSGVGLGLGLHVSKTIIERHGGEVGVESTPGQGATFWFTLPVSDIAAGEAGE